jgi:hypothetical protein
MSALMLLHIAGYGHFKKKGKFKVSEVKNAPKREGAERTGDLSL